MENAKAHVKRAADEVTLSCDEDGVAVFFRINKAGVGFVICSRIGFSI